MRIDSDDSRHDLLTAADDAFHAPNAYDDLFRSSSARWFHETAWFWWYVPEEKLGGWFYNWVRPNIGTSGGGAWVWDDMTHSHFEVPYYACYANLPFEEGADLRDFRFPSGVAVKCLEPLTRYHLGYADRDLLTVDLDFGAVMPPWVGSPVGAPPAAIHFDQVGRVTGTMTLHGTSYDVDCLAIRDRTWSPRPERWKDGRVGYCNACNDETAFLASSAAGMRGQDEERIRSGYFLNDGRRAALVDGTRLIERDPQHGFLKRITVEAEDRDGRRFTATGEGLSRMAMPIPGVQGVVWASLVDWIIEGEQAWGEDQDAWPIQGWSAFRRLAGTGR
ncbi:MAG: hypothetical protein ACHQNA_00790 [Acidimicrobiales bacterium]